MAEKDIAGVRAAIDRWTFSPENPWSLDLAAGALNIHAGGPCTAPSLETAP